MKLQQLQRLESPPAKVAGDLPRTVTVVNFPDVTLQGAILSKLPAAVRTT